MVEVLAAGAVLWRSAGSAIEIALVHRPRYDDWSLPKGKLEPGENLWAAAAREVAEETGFAAVLLRYLTRVSYPLSAGVTKIVDYVCARALPGRFQPNPEVDELRWLPVGEAANLLSYRHDHAVLRAFTALPPDTTTLLLVRHARAGRRENWPGPDALRPLSSAGWRQADALRALLPRFGVSRVHSAPLVRCHQTVQRPAADLDTPIIEEPLLSERGYLTHEDAAVARIHEIATAGGAAVVCSQGGVIPDLLSRLAARADLFQGRVESRKGSAWLLSFTPGPHLAAAHYIPKP